MPLSRLLILSWTNLLLAACGGEPSPPAALAIDRLPFAWRAYTAPFTTASPVIDGRPDEAAWQVAPWSEPFVDIEGDKQPLPPLATRMRMMWSREGLYIAAWLEEPHIWATLDTDESVIYQDNDFEVFIDPDGDTHLYYEYEINARGTEWDLLLVKPYRDGGPYLSAWDIEGLRSAVQVWGTPDAPRDRDSAWTVELFFPWASLLEGSPRVDTPRAGDVWRINFSRVNWDSEVVAGQYRKRHDPATSKPLPEHNWVWSPPGLVSMHEPEKWGFLHFGETARDSFLLPDEVLLQWGLREAYLRQRTHREQQGRYATHLSALGLGALALPWGEVPLAMQATDDQYRIAAEGPDGRRWYIDQEGRCRSERPPGR